MRRDSPRAPVFSARLGWHCRVIDEIVANEEPQSLVDATPPAHRGESSKLQEKLRGPVLQRCFLARDAPLGTTTSAASSSSAARKNGNMRLTGHRKERQIFSLGDVSD